MNSSPMPPKLSFSPWVYLIYLPLGALFCAIGFFPLLGKAAHAALYLLLPFGLAGLLILFSAIIDCVRSSVPIILGEESLTLFLKKFPAKQIRQEVAYAEIQSFAFRIATNRPSGPNRPAVSPRYFEVQIVNQETPLIVPVGPQHKGDYEAVARYVTERLLTSR